MDRYVCRTRKRPGAQLTLHWNDGAFSDRGPCKASRAPVPSSADLCTRVPGKEFFKIINKLPDVDVDETGTTDDFLYLDLKLPKSGSRVSTDPLFNLALKAAKPNATATVNAELSFAEIA